MGAVVGRDWLFLGDDGGKTGSVMNKKRRSECIHNEGEGEWGKGSV